MILIDNVEVKFGKFPNGEGNLNFNKIKFHSHTNVVVKYETDQDLFNLFILKRYIDEVIKFNSCITLTMLYMPYSRMDRQNNFYTFNLKYVCDFINQMKFHKVFVYDVHSDVTPALLNNYQEKSSIDELFGMFMKDYEREGKDTTEDLYVFFPDAGAQKRYDKGFGYPQLVGMKSRDFSNGEITKYSVHGEFKKGANIVIIDDLCSKGGTFMAAGKALKEQGAGEISLIVGHCEDNIFNGEILAYNSDIKRVYTTNSILTDGITHDKFVVLPLYKKGERYK